MGFDEELASSSSRTVPPREDTPLLSPRRFSSSSSSQWKTFANVFIAIVGSGVLGLPYTFMKTGWLFGSLMLFSVAFLTYHCMMLLVTTRHRLDDSCLRLLGYSKIASFGDLGFAICGPIGRFSVDVMIVLAQAGFCVSYLIFISTTLSFLLDSPRSLYIWGCFPFQLGLNSIPTLTHLAPLSVFADVVDLAAMGVVMVEDVFIFLQQRPALQAFGGLSVFFYGVGVAVYAFEGIGMILPLESEAKDKDKFGKVLGLCMAFIAVLYGGFGVLGYFAFGEETRDIITTNFGQGLVSTLVQVGPFFYIFYLFIFILFILLTTKSVYDFISLMF